MGGGRSMMLGLGLLGLLLLRTTDVAALTTRAQCLAACAPAIAQCGSTCAEFGDLDAACKRAVLKRCRRDGIGACVGATTSTTTSTTTAPSTTSPHVTTTTRATTTTTTPTGLSCTLPRGLPIGGSVNGDTSNATDHGPGVGCMQNAQAPDLVYVVQPPSDGTLTLALTSDWDGGLYVRTTCDAPDTEIACVDVLGDNATEVLTLAVTAGTTYYVYVDGYTTESYGAYTLDSDLE